jgi:hypothetical protein
MYTQNQNICFIFFICILKSANVDNGDNIDIGDNIDSEDNIDSCEKQLKKHKL